MGTMHQPSKKKITNTPGSRFVAKMKELLAPPHLKDHTHAKEIEEKDEVPIEHIPNEEEDETETTVGTPKISRHHQRSRSMDIKGNLIGAKVKTPSAFDGDSLRGKRSENALQKVWRNIVAKTQIKKNEEKTLDQ